MKLPFPHFLLLLTLWILCTACQRGVPLAPWALERWEQSSLEEIAEQVIGERGFRRN